MLQSSTMTLLHRVSRFYPKFSLNFHAPCICRIPASFYGTEAAFVSSVEKYEKYESVAKLKLKKRSYTEEEQRSSFGKLVYLSPMNNTIYWCKLLSLSTSITTVVVTPIILTNMMSDNSEVGFVAPTIFSVFSTLFVFTPLLLHKLTKRIVFEMYYNGDRDLYTAVFMNIFLSKRALSFRLADVKGANAASAMLVTHTVGKNPLVLHRVGYKDEETCRVFESMLDRIEFDEEKGDDDDNDEPAKATTDHHKRQLDQ